MKIKDILKSTEGRTLPIIKEDETVRDVLKKIVAHPHTRLIYVVNKEGTYVGVISLGTLIRNVFPHFYEPAVHPRSLIRLVTSETAKDIMNKQIICATYDESVESVVERMIKAKIKEIAIVDEEKKIIADVTMLDLLQHYHLTEDV